MAARTRRLDSKDGPLAVLAIDLRRLRNHAPDDRPKSIKEVADASTAREHASRAAIYAAMSGKVLPSRETLGVMVKAWAPGREQDLAPWMERREQCEQALAGLARSAPPVAPQKTTARTAPFGKELRRMREERGLSLAALGLQIYLSRGYLSKIESGRARGSYQVALAADTALEAHGTLAALFLESAR